MFLAFLLWEKRYAKDPIMPLSVFQAPTFTALVFVVLLVRLATVGALLAVDTLTH